MLKTQIKISLVWNALHKLYEKNLRYLINKQQFLQWNYSAHVLEVSISFLDDCNSDLSLSKSNFKHLRCYKIPVKGGQLIILLPISRAD